MNAEEILSTPAHCVVSFVPRFSQRAVEHSAQLAARYVTAQRPSIEGPAIERVFQLTRAEGSFALMASNSWTHREYGRALREKVLPRVDLTHIVGTEGAFLEGVGTPTLILAGTGDDPRSGSVRVVESGAGERQRPRPGNSGLVWASIRSRLGLGPAPSRAYGPQGERIARAIGRSLGAQGPLTELSPPGRFGGRAMAPPPPPTRLGEWIAAGALVRAFAARGFATRDDEPLSESIVRLHETLAVDPAGWLSELAQEPLPALRDEALRVALVATPPECGWASEDTEWLGDLLHHADERRGFGFEAEEQPPWYVCDLLLDLTLARLLREPPREMTVLDPHCRTGHTLATSFWRLRAAWAVRSSRADAATEALMALRGVAHNASDAALARYRLTLAWLDASGESLRGGARPPVPLVATGDALLEGPAYASPPDAPLTDAGRRRIAEAMGLEVAA